MRRWLLFALVLLASPGVFAHPGEALAHAWVDAKALAVVDPAKVRRTRYLDLTHRSEAQRVGDTAALNSLVNGFGEYKTIVRLRPVAGGAVLALDLGDYGYERLKFVYGRLNGLDAAEPYYHVVIETDDGYGKKARASAAAPWLDQKQITELIALTGSQVPVLRGDWVFATTCLQAGSEGHGYYDFTSAGKTLAEFQKRFGVDEKRADELNLLLAASVGKSRVALNNRGVARVPSLPGSYWATADYKTSVDRQNALRLLKGDTKPPVGDAAEIYATMPNGLFAFFLADADGKRQDSAPDFIASDGVAPGTDRRVHVGLSCVRCHREGLRPIEDHSRRLYQGDLQLRSPDYDRLVRLRDLYLSDLDYALKRDRETYERALLLCNGLTPPQNAAAWAGLWAEYAEEPVTPAVAAAELGCAEAELVAAVKGYVAKAQIADPVVSGFAAAPPIPLRREHFAEQFWLFNQLLGRGVQK